MSNQLGRRQRLATENRELKQRLAEAQATVAAILSGEVDALIEPASQTPLLLHHAQQQLRDSEQTFRAIFDSALDAMVIAGDKGQFLDANPAACKLFGTAKESLLGRKAADFAAPGFDFDAAWGAIEETNRERGEFHLARPDGSVRATEYSVVTSFLPGRHLFIMRDVTERMQMEQERARALYDLHERVKEATLLQIAGRTLSEPGRTARGLLEVIVELIPPAWQYPDITAARIVFGDLVAATQAYAPTPWTLRAGFRTKVGTRGSVEVVYLEERPQAAIGPFLDEERATLDALAQMLQADLERRQYERELQAIAALSEALRGAQTHDDVLPVVLRHAQENLGAESAAMGLIHEATGEIVMERVLGDWPEMEGVRIQPGEGVTGRVIASGEPFVTTDLAAETGFLRPDVLGDVYASVCMPLIAQSRPVGAMWAVRSRPFTREEIGLMEVIAESAANALQRVILHEQVRTQASRVQRLIDAVDDGLILINSHRRVLLTNPAADRHLARLNVDVTVGSRLTRLDNLAIEEVLASPRSGGSAHEITIEQPTERIFEVEAHTLAEATDGGGWVLVLRDTTEARHLQERMQQQDRLAAVGQLAAGIAHDFNNVMSSIILYAQMLQRRSDLSEKEHERLRVIYTQANHGANLIRQILDFSRRSVMEKNAADLVTFCKELVRLWRRTLPETIAVDLYCEEEEIVVEADLTRLQQAFMNLAINARDAMKEGGQLSLSLSKIILSGNKTPPLPEMEAGRWVRITIADNGTGIPSHVVDRIFDPFFTTKERGQGTGLGLAQVHGIVQQHGGHIAVKSQVGAGTTFTIYLPLLELAAQHDEGSIPDLTVATAPPGTTVLVVEDEEQVRVAIEEMLAILGYSVLAEDNGRSALETFRKHVADIDIVLSDMVMPVMSGISLYQELKATKPDVKMIIMTGYPLEDGGRALLEQGIVDWIQKPFAALDLAQKIGDLAGA